MRTMLIPLILVCSLAQFAIAGNLIDSGGCGTTYTCYAPAKCTRIMQPAQLIYVEKIQTGMQIFDDCDAIFRFHEYGTHRAHIIMESYSPTVQTIEFHQTGSDGKNKNKFTCKVETVNGDVAVGKFQAKTLQEIDTYKGKVPHGTNDKLKCEFEVKISRAIPGLKTFFDQPLDNSKDKIFFNIDGVSTTVTEENIEDPRCDPENLEYISYEKKFNEKKLYKKVEHKPGEYFCDKTYPYTFEYRLDEGNFIAAEKFECMKNVFGAKTAKDTDVVSFGDADAVIDIRCVVDTDYFCKYPPPVVAGKKQLIGSNMGDADKHKKTGLACTKEEPHLVITSSSGGRDKVIRDVKSTHFSCVARGREPVWLAGGVLLKKSGPQAYCAAEVDCNLIEKIRDNAVKDGRLNNVGLPICHFTGTLYVNSEEAHNRVTNPRCDRKTGNFMYTAGNADHKITPDTKFVCFYPKKIPNKKNKENVQKIVTGVAGAAGGAAGLVVVIGIGLALYLRWKVAKEKKQRELRAKEEDRACVKFTMNSKEKKAYLATHKAEESNESDHAGKNSDQIAEEKSAKDELGTWNELQMSFQHIYRMDLLAEKHIPAKDNGTCEPGVFNRKIKIDKDRQELLLLKRPADARQKSRINYKSFKKDALKAEATLYRYKSAIGVYELINKITRPRTASEKAKSTNYH